MRDLLALFICLIVAITRLMGSGGARALVAENLLLEQQMLVLNRARKRAPRLTVVDRFLFGASSLSLTPRRILQAAIVLSLRRYSDFTPLSSNASTIYSIPLAGAVTPVPKDSLKNSFKLSSR